VAARNGDAAVQAMWRTREVECARRRAAQSLLEDLDQDYLAQAATLAALHYRRTLLLRYVAYQCDAGNPSGAA
jgi:hypothetical protein